MRSMKSSPYRPLLLCVVVALACAACGPADDSQKPTRSLQQIRDSGKLIVLTRNAPTAWYLDRNGESAGPEYEMVEAYASTLGVEVEYKLKPTVKLILKGIENAEGDLAAAGLTITQSRRERFRFGPAYQDVTQQVVCRRDRVQPESIEELTKIELKVIADSSYSQRLEALQKKHPDLKWMESETQSTGQLLYQVWKRELECTIADSNIVDINRRYFPELIAPFNLNRSQSLGWVMSLARKDLQESVEDWFGPYRNSGRLANMQETYYGFFEVFDYVDVRRFIRRIDSRFPKYREYFRQAAKKYDLPPLLLSAQAYQESHWRARARSPTGVRGIMMLTLNTAEAMGVENRLNPVQSIFGGAKYLSRLKGGLDEAVTEPDRTWLALAAYNVGRGHLLDAQKLARKQGLNPHRWRDIKQVLPLLADKRYYRRLKYGYARGTEPVRYVRRIREYQHILENELK